MKKRIRIILPLVLIIVASSFGYKYFKAEGNGSELRFSGNIEVTETRMSFQIPGRLQERLVDEGDEVRAGQPLARLDKTDQEIGLARTRANLLHARAVLAELEAGSRQEDIDRAEAGVAQALESLTELRNGSRIEEIEASKAALQSAEAAEHSAKVQLAQTEKDVSRYSRLYKENSVSKNVLETYQTAFETAESMANEAQARTRAAREQLRILTAGPRIEQIRRAEAALKQARAEYALVVAGPRSESIDQAKARLLVAEEDVRGAERQLGYTEITAPADGVILTTSAEPGEYMNPASPVLTLGELGKPWLRAYINETSLGLVRLNQQVSVFVDTFPDKLYTGRLSFISSQAEFTPKTVQTFEERVKLMYRVKVTLDNPHHELKPGMPADGFVELAAGLKN
jgi:HlyD family secretion protein